MNLFNSFLPLGNDLTTQIAYQSYMDASSKECFSKALRCFFWLLNNSTCARKKTIVAKLPFTKVRHDDFTLLLFRFWEAPKRLHLKYSHYWIRTMTNMWRKTNYLEMDKMFWICLRTKANLIHRVGFKMFRKYCIAIFEETTLTSKPACSETFFCS